MKRLIVTADDFGLAFEVNEAVELAHRKGILSAASLMVAAPAAADAIYRANRLPGLKVGLHLVLVEQRPMLPAGLIPDLVGADGLLRTDMARLGLDIAINPRVRHQLRQEIEAQFEAYRQTGLALDHVNSHKHFHIHPLIARDVIEIGRRHGMAGLRVPHEPSSLLRQVEPVGHPLTPTVMAPWAALLRRQARKAGLMTPDRVVGLRWSGAMTAGRLSGILRHLPQGVTEVYSHPAVVDRFEGSAPDYRYGEELAALISPDSAEALRAAGIIGTGYGPATRLADGMAA